MLQIKVDSREASGTVQRLMTVMSPDAVLKNVAQWLVAYISESFSGEGTGPLHSRYSGLPRWAPLAQGTLETRKRGGNKALQDTGEYRKSWTGQVGHDNPAPRTDRNTYVEVGTSMTPLAFWHEYGTGMHGAGRGWYLIEAKNKKVLAARLRSGGYRVFGRYVKHEGVPARPVLPTMAAAESGLKDLLEAMLARLESLERAVDRGF